MEYENMVMDFPLKIDNDIIQQTYCIPAYKHTLPIKCH